MYRDCPFFTKCAHCSFQIERSEVCTELKHCNISICSLCGYKAAPGEKTINTDHWKTCFRYEDELLEFVGARRHDTHYLHSLRRALHMVRFFEQLSDHNRVEASVYLHELLESSEFVEDKFANAKDFQFGCFLRRARRSAGCFGELGDDVNDALKSSNICIRLHKSIILSKMAISTCGILGCADAVASRKDEDDSDMFLII